MIAADSKELEEKIGYHFKNKALLKQALTHSSFANEQKINKQKNYERIEFLGDAVLELASSKFFYLNHPDMSEGAMTKMRSSCVCEPALAYCARDLQLEKYILLGKGEEATGGRKRDSIISDVMEAVIGAIYLDSDFDTAEKFILTYILSDLENKQLFYDSKTILQEKVQKRGSTLYYELLSEEGPDHDKEFVVELFIDNESMAKGKGKTKKAAEQQAAYAVLIRGEN